MYSLRGAGPDVGSNPALEYWHGLEARQPEWALRAYARLVSTLSQDVQQRLQLKDAVAEPYVVVFGKTQVGKTTLLLDLMGIAPGQLARVSKVLRGGRDAGQSATATTMEYCRSTSEQWGLSRKGELRWLPHDEAMSQALGELRSAMEQGHLKAETVPCVVHIPRSCFLGDARGPGVRMLDLPGDKPANQEEQRHVHQMARTYLPFADLILLVGKGDDLGFLRPGEITLPGIEDWQAMPYRFRIVTTYSYNAKSVKDILRTEPQVDAAQVRQRLIEQVERFGMLSEPAREARLYFPLEFGNSWLQTEKDEPQLHARMAPIINHLRDELLEQITSSTTPMGRLRSTLDTHVSVRYIQKQKTLAIDEALKGLADRKSAAVTELKSWKAVVEKSQKKVEEARSLLANKPAELGKELIDRATPGDSGGSSMCVVTVSFDADDRETLYGALRRQRHSLGDMRLDVAPGNCPASYWRRVRSALQPPQKRMVERAMDEEFAPVWQKLNDYWFDTYLSSSNYQADRREVLEACASASAKLTALWRRQWHRALAETDQAFHREFVQLQAESEQHREAFAQAGGRQADIEKEIVEHRARRVRIVQDSKEDLERCERFIGLLKEEYGAALDRKYTTALAQPDPADALLGLLSCIALGQQYQEFLALNQREAN